jgi:hypothetical protein
MGDYDNLILVGSDGAYSKDQCRPNSGGASHPRYLTRAMSPDFHKLG